MISILMAAYNGEKYITRQIESILSQTCRDFKLYIRDDRSTDNTLKIIQDYADKNPGIIFIKQNNENTGGTKKNFLDMMIDIKDDYIMLCDQDDIWLPDKIEKSLKLIREMEREHGSSTPVLVHTDLTVVNNNLDVISSSYKKMSGKNFNKTSLNHVVALNNIAGCTAMYNRALADFFQDVPDFFVMHDWWLSLTAAVYGKIASLKESTILYRQHEGNEKGAKKVLSPGYVFYVLTNLKTMAGLIDDSYAQAGSFVDLHREKLSEEQLKLLAAYASIPGLSRVKRLQTVFKYKTFMHGTARKVMQVIFLLVNRKNNGEQGTGNR